MYQVMFYGHMIEVKIMEKLLVVMAKRRLRLLNRGLIPHSFPLLFGTLVTGCLIAGRLKEV